MKDKKNILEYFDFMGRDNGIIILIVSLIIGIFIGGIFFILSGFDPFSAYAFVFTGAFGSESGIMLTISQSTPLIFSGLAFAFASKAGLVNIGTEGQLYVGGFFAAVAGIYINVPNFLQLPIALLCGIIAGGLWGLLTGWLKVRFDASEVVSSIMLNTIVVGLVGYILSRFLIEDGSISSQTIPIKEAAAFTKFSPKYQATTAYILAIILCIVVYFILKYTVFGYEVKAIGENKKAAETAGINYKRIVLIVMLISGGIAALGGAGQTLGVDGRFVEGFSNNYGFDGIAVASLASLNPIGVIFTGILFGALRAGSMTLNRVAGVPMDFVTIIQAFIILSVASPMLIKEIIKPFSRLKNKAVKSEVVVENE